MKHDLAERTQKGSSLFYYRKKFQQHIRLPKAKACPFCDAEIPASWLKETPHTYVVRNRTEYDVWELRQVTEHLLAVPKRHVSSLQELTSAEQVDLMQLIAKYEAAGYNLYARAKKSEQRSIAHQHTHLIKTHTPQARGLLLVREPYTFITF